MEMSKLIPGLIPQFELQLEHPEKESRVYNDCFYEAKGVEVLGGVLGSKGRVGGVGKGVKILNEL